MRVNTPRDADKRSATMTRPEPRKPSSARRFAEARTGATAIEYALLAGIIAVGLLATMQALGGGVSGSWTGTILPQITAVMN